MCGIIGYVGKSQALPVLLNGLENLEYRGYDSAGIAVYNEDAIVVKKTEGRLKDLKKIIDKPITGNIGIGHTRWATHGKPSDRNAHPHTDESENFAVVHNGIIENYLELKEKLSNEGHFFKSDTDTEVIAHLLAKNYTDNVKNAIIKTLSEIEGSYALGIIYKETPYVLYAVRKDSPLIIGINNTEKFITSDASAISCYTQEVIYPDNNQIAEITAEKVVLYDTDRCIVPINPSKIEHNYKDTDKGNFKHYMMKEIMEQPEVFEQTIKSHLQDNKIVFNNLDINFERIKRIQFIACGSAYYAGWVGKYVMEKILKIPVEVCIASEYRYQNPVTNCKTLAIVISQSGETADTLAALKEAKKLEAKTLSIVNVKGSSIARESDNVIYTSAGTEVAVATTKAYTSQLAVIYMLTLYIAEKIEPVKNNIKNHYLDELKLMPQKIEAVLKNADKIDDIAKANTNFKNIFYIGRGVDYAACMEGCLKLKEISYIPSEAYAAGELKHGTISLVEEGTLVIAASTRDNLMSKMLSNIEEVKTRGGKIILITKDKHREIDCEANIVLHIPECDDLFTASLTVVIFQIFSYYIALYKGCDIDKPRNLAKSVTVE